MSDIFLRKKEIYTKIQLTIDPLPSLPPRTAPLGPLHGQAGQLEPHGGQQPVRGRRPARAGNGGKVRQRRMSPLGLDGVVALFAVQVLHVAHGPPEAGRVLQVWQRQRQRPVRRAGQTRHQAGVLQRDVQGRVAGRAVVRGRTREMCIILR